jgi:hypothetical protein
VRCEHSHLFFRPRHEHQIRSHRRAWPGRSEQSEMQNRGSSVGGIATVLPSSDQTAVLAIACLSTQHSPKHFISYPIQKAPNFPKESSS